MKTILITTSSFGTYDTTPLDRLKDFGFEVVLNPYGRKLTENEAASLIETCKPVGMIAGVEPLTADVLGKTSGLKVISRCGIGLDSVDLETAAQMGILVTNTPDAPTIPVAELTLGLMLSLLRRIHISDSGIRNGQWHRPMGNLIYGKTVGIIGCGRIGTYVAGLLSPFQCKILGYDVYPHSNAEAFQPSDLSSLISESDIITLHIPYSPENHHFINCDRIKAMKEGSCLINAARGGLADEDALYDALKSGHLGGAALDSFEQEPYSGPLKELNNVLLTCHIGSYAAEGRIMMENQSIDNLLKELSKAGVIHGG